jgi:uncharacterized protein
LETLADRPAGRNPQHRMEHREMIPESRSPVRHALALGALLGMFVALPGHSVAATSSDAEAATGAWLVPTDVMELPVLLDPIDTDWRVLLGLDYRSGEASAALKEREGKTVRIPGFMVPFDDGYVGVNEFILVPYFGACIHTPPPPPNQMVYVRMEGGQEVEVNIWDAIYVEGTFTLESIDSPFGSVGHQVLGQRIRPYGNGEG